MICKATIKFSDDYGDNETTFHCQHNSRHKGTHQESGVIDGKHYSLLWHKGESNGEKK